MWDHEPECPMTSQMVPRLSVPMTRYPYPGPLRTFRTEAVTVWAWTVEAAMPANATMLNPARFIFMAWLLLFM